MNGAERIPFAEATRGHTIGLNKPPEFRIWSIWCSCGWYETRPRVHVTTGIGHRQKTRSAPLPMAEFRSLGDIHLHAVWMQAQQGQLA